MKDEDFLDLIITRLSIYIFFPLSAKKKLLGVALIVLSREDWRHHMVRAFSFAKSQNH